jgi:exosome complex RNA-binding protein Rrp42 (RNase PH superfamily)
LDRCGLWIDAASLGTYAALVQTIKEQSQPAETIFVIPNDPELYFLADRRNPFKFWNSAIGIVDSEEAEARTSDHQE